MASPIQQQSRIPYETAKDCSQGFCSIYCPQWCYIIFPPPPPPPFSFVDGDDSSGSTTFSPLVIAIIGILASAFLLVCYYTIVSKYCGGFRRRRSHRNPIIPDDRVDDDDDSGGGDQSRRHEANWHVPPSEGLDRALINKISVYKYRRGEGLVDGTDCSVCLGEFREDESLRLLPKCSHAFHLRCIDTWLSSHSNCPLCRANIASVNPAPPPDSPARPPPPPPESSSTTEGGQSDEMVVLVDGSGEETNSEVSDDDDDTPKEENHDIIEIRDDGNGGLGVQTVGMSFPMDSSNMGRISIADVLRRSMDEDELVMEKDQGTCSSSRGEKTRSS